MLRQIQPDLVSILHHNIAIVLNQSPVYRGVQNLPEIGNVPQQLSQQLAHLIGENIYKAIVAALEDPVGATIST